MTDNPLKALEPYRDYLTVVSNTDVRMAEAFALPEIGGDHFRSSAVFLTQSHPKQTQGSDIWCGTSMDQMYAQRFGQSTPLPVDAVLHREPRPGRRLHLQLLLRLHRLDQLGVAERSAADDPRPARRLRHAVRLGRLDCRSRRAPRRRAAASSTGLPARSLTCARNWAPADRTRLDRYLDNVREIERRIQAIEARNSSGEARELPGAPAGVPDSFTEHMRLMFDLQVLALETDMTRIITFKTGRDSQNRVFPECESTQPFHPASHHGNREERILEFNKICKFRVGQLPYFLEKLKSDDGRRPEPAREDGVMWGSPMADANVHNHRRCPLVLLGHGNGMLEGRPPPQGRRRHADGQRHADAAHSTRARRPVELRRQHRRVLVPAVGDHRLGGAPDEPRRIRTCDFG